MRLSIWLDLVPSKKHNSECNFRSVSDIRRLTSDECRTVPWAETVDGSERTKEAKSQRWLPSSSRYVSVWWTQMICHHERCNRYTALLLLSLLVIVCFTCMSCIHRCQKIVTDPLELKYRWLWAAMWVLGIKLKSFERTLIT